MCLTYKKKAVQVKLTAKDPEQKIVSKEEIAIAVCTRWRKMYAPKNPRLHVRAEVEMHAGVHP